ncbi:hypothetical protein [Neorhizobium petrolearium]|uniref:hypothetical protein n=1 Tax=Neorhizobium petrolearium TaxID=515361 RepID=UPI003F13E7EF
MESEILADIIEAVGPLPVSIITRAGNEEIVVTADELAGWLDITTGRVQTLTREGHLPRLDRGRFPLRAAIRAYLAYVRQNPTGRRSNDPALAEERRRLVREQADREALRNAQARGELVTAAEVEARWTAILTDLRARLLAVPSRVGGRAFHFTVADLDIVDREIRDALTEVTDGNARPGCSQRYADASAAAPAAVV